jgi:molybdopterin molybdotransferase
VDILHVRDNASLLQQQVKKSLYEADVLLITGGISVGEHDYVHEALLHNNVKTLFYKVKQKPGKPMYCGRQNNKWVFALPGNPAAVLMCMNQYVIPCLKSMMGYPLAFHPNHTAPILNEWHKKDTLTHILKASLGTQGVTILNGQESFNLSSFAEANCFVQMPEDVAFFHKCDIVDVYLW